jgi:muramoyltetrapeptide carboxypeptidase
MSEIKNKTVIPPRLVSGDTIALISPAGPLKDQEAAATGMAILENAGFLVKLPEELASEGYLAGSDQDRARQFTEACLDPEVKALLAMRGGYGSMRLLPLLDFAQLSKTPKILAGFSDITVLLNVIQRRTGIVTYHTPVLTTLARSNEDSQRSFLKALSGPATNIQDNTIEILTGGRAIGRLLGGNLTTIAHLLGTPYELELDSAILFIEDVGEEAYKIDRMLTQLSAAGHLQKLAGLIIGTFTDSNGCEDDRAELVWARALALTGGEIPLWGGFPVGHGARNMTLPLGLEAVMDPARKTLELLSD